MKQWYSRHWTSAKRRVTPEKQKTIEISPTIAQLSALREFQGHGAEAESRLSMVDFWSSESEVSEAALVCRTDH